jgi:hypothetical protein
LILPYYNDSNYIFDLELEMYYEELSSAVSKWGITAKQDIKKFIKARNDISNAMKSLKTIIQLNDIKEYKDASVCQLGGNLKTLITRKKKIVFSFRKQLVCLITSIISHSIKYYYPNFLKDFDFSTIDF